MPVPSNLCHCRAAPTTRSIPCFFVRIPLPFLLNVFPSIFTSKNNNLLVLLVLVLVLVLLLL